MRKKKMNKFVGQTLFVILLFCVAAAACAPATGQSSGVTPVPLDEMALVPAGPFSMGNSVERVIAECQKFRDDCERAWYTIEEPVHTVDLPAFYMDVYEVTNAGYKACVDAGKCQPPRLSSSATHESYYGNAQYANHPVINVSWDNARTYCEWRGARLPSEAEWEKAARGTDARMYPWGEGLDTTRANYFDSKLGDPVAVGSYESGKSPYGIYDMTGNVWEWTADWYDVYPGGDPGASTDFGQTGRALRGGAWIDAANAVHSTNRGGLDPTRSFGNIGFRCARSASD
jgi:eukaryotic-like serine/threonine-protein kinase